MSHAPIDSMIPAPPEAQVRFTDSEARKVWFEPVVAFGLVCGDVAPIVHDHKTGHPCSVHEYLDRRSNLRLQWRLELS